MSTPTAAGVLTQLAYLAEVRGTPDAADLRQAVRAIDALAPRDRVPFDRSLLDPESNFPHLNDVAVQRLRQAAAAGPDRVVAAARATIPSLFRRLLDIGAVTHAEAASLAREAGIATLQDLEAALDDHRMRRFPADLTARLRRAATSLAGEGRPLPLGRAYELLSTAMDLVRAQCPNISELSMAGDVRRFEQLVTGLALVGRAEDPAGAIEAICTALPPGEVLHRTVRRAVILFQQAEVDVRVAAPDEYGSVLFAATGSHEHVRNVASIRRPATLHAREEDVYAHHGLPWIAPELRQGAGEIQAASQGRLPQLVARSDIRGDLHMHSTYSDGQDSVERMVAASVALGYEYIALTDHSERAGAVRTITIDQLARQRDDIERLRQHYPAITILHGIEVDILPDGRLDFGDAVLEKLDIVLASLHDAARQDGPALTRRCIQAIRHPLVTVITHPANQLVGRRRGYPLDFDAVYAAAAETGTALEIDGAPSHLDLDGEHARAAIAAGVTVTIDSDCHRAGALERQMQFGVGTARRGWVEARHVLNCRPIAEVRAFVRAKRERNGAC